MADAPAVSPQTRDLASRIYADLVIRSVHVAETSVKMDAAPAFIAKLSFKLAAAFDSAEQELNQAGLSKGSDYKVDVAAIASWTK